MADGSAKSLVSALVGKLDGQDCNSPQETSPGLRGDYFGWPCPPGTRDLAAELLLPPYYAAALADPRDCKVRWDKPSTFTEPFQLPSLSLIHI